MEIIEDKHGKGAIIIASQLSIISWHQIVIEQTIADAILDRLVYSVNGVELKDESMGGKKNCNFDIKINTFLETGL